MRGALPTVQMTVNDVKCETLIDTGCTKCIVHMSLCAQWTKEKVSVITLSGEPYKCVGTGTVLVQLSSGVSVSVSAIVVPYKPLNFSFILGMNGIAALRGVKVYSPSDVRFGIEEVQALAAAETDTPDINEKDFRVTYNINSRKWTVL